MIQINQENEKSTDEISNVQSNDNSASIEDIKPIEIKKITPLPIKKITLLGFILAANNTSIWMIFAFLPFMVNFFYPDLSLNEIGFKAGLLGSAFSTGSLLGNIMWGILSDKIGRRPALLYGLIGTAISSLCFGFSTTYWFAILSRFMWGFLNGNIGVSKTYMAEILDDSNSAKGMALYGVIGGIGRTIGPVIGGFLSMPANHYKIFKNTIFETFPFALPCFVISFNCLIILVVSYYELNETLLSKLNQIKKDNKRNKINKLFINSKLNNKTKYTQLVSDDSSDSVDIELSTSKIDSPNKRLLSDMDDSSHSPPPSPIIKRNNLYSQIYVNDPDSPDEEVKEYTVHDDIKTEQIDSQLDSKLDSQLDRKAHRVKKSKVKSKVTFTGYVMVKCIDTNDITYGKLNQIKDNDSPIDTVPADRFVISPITTNKISTSLPTNPLIKDDDITKDDFNITVTPEDKYLPDVIPLYSNGSENIMSKPKKSFLQSIFYLLSQKQILISTLLYGVNAFNQLASTEIIPLWVVTSVHDGGFNYNSHLIGVATMITGPITILFQILIYPMMIDKYGILNTYMFGSILFSISIFIIPSFSLLNQLNNSVVIFIAIVTAISCLSISAQCVLITIFVLINNSCYSYQRGTVNGIGQTFASLGRLSGPYVGANLFAWSETNSLSWPFNYYFSFYLFGVFGILFTKLGSLLPKSIQRRKREPKVPRYTDSDDDGNYEDDSEDIDDNKIIK